MELKNHKGENILLIGDFNSRNKILDRNIAIIAEWASYLKTLLIVMTFR